MASCCISCVVDRLNLLEVWLDAGASRPEGLEVADCGGYPALRRKLLLQKYTGLQPDHELAVGPPRLLSSAQLTVPVTVLADTVLLRGTADEDASSFPMRRMP
ncbi:MAG: hypothetical protein QOJ19_807 [Acidimicrobiia bacterium]|nr:hypothetical protein [Acidimicrobiia bacterium]